MTASAIEVANLLLREGCLRRENTEHAEIYKSLMANQDLYQDVRGRLGDVGYQLVNHMGHLGVRLIPSAATIGAFRNNMGLNAGHIRLLTYLWVHLIYREWIDLRVESKASSTGLGQEQIFALEAERSSPWMDFSIVRNDFREITSDAQFAGLLTKLTREMFIRSADKRIYAGPALYVLIDFHAMEEFVIGLARRLGATDAAQAVLQIATGSKLPDQETETE